VDFPQERNLLRADFRSDGPLLPTGIALEGTKPLRVLIAENHRDLSDVMSQLIDTEPDMHCVGQVSDATEVLAAARDASADVLILDLMLQGGSGLPLVEELTNAMPELRVIIFSGLANSEEVAREVKRRGAAAFVTKGCDFRVLLDALRPSQAPRLAG
jgi:two-component system response regulator DesR